MDFGMSDKQSSPVMLCGCWPQGTLSRSKPARSGAGDACQAPASLVDQQYSIDRPNRAQFCAHMALALSGPCFRLAKRRHISWKAWLQPKPSHGLPGRSRWPLQAEHGDNVLPQMSQKDA